MHAIRMFTAAVAVTVLGAGAVSAAPTAAPSSAVVEPALLRQAGPGPVVALATVAAGEQSDVARRLHGSGLGVIVFEHLPFVAVRGTAADVRRAARVPGVRRLSADSPVRYALSSTLPAARIDAAQRTGLTGRGVGIAVIDSGVDATHPDLRDAVRENVKVLAEDDSVWQLTHGLGVLRPSQLPDAASLVVPADNGDTHGHGTHVAGTAAGRGTAAGGRYLGAAPGAHLLGVGLGEAGSVLWVLAAMEHVLERREALDIQVMNASIVGLHAEPVLAYDPEAPVNVASRALHDAGIAVVFAAGNDGPAQDTLNVYAVWPWVLGVGNVCVTGKPLGFQGCSRPSDDGTVALADGSARGVPGHPLRHPDLVAPGMFVVAPRSSVGSPGLDPDADLMGTCGARGADDFLAYRCMSGTSMSAPHVAGVLALMEEAAGRDLTPAELMQLVTGSARPLPPLQVWEAGAGMLDGLAAVTAARELAASRAPRPCEPEHPGRPRARSCR